MENRSDDGSIIITFAVMMVVTGLVLALATLTDRGLVQSRQAGESANALQVADAGVNDAVRSIVDGAGAVEDGQITIRATRSLAGAGSYSYVAKRHPTKLTWRITSTGTDSAGVKRRVVANATPISLFSNALFVNSSLTMASGSSVDSYTNGSSAAAMCTGNGTVGTNDAESVEPNNAGLGTGVTNCRDASFPYAFDGCIGYGDPEPPADFDPGVKCPPAPLTTTDPDELVLPQINLPPSCADEPAADPCFQTHLGDLVCGAGLAITSLQPGVYTADSVTLRRGCTLNITNAGDQVHLYVNGNVELGNSTGPVANNNVNRPPTSATLCPNSLASVNDQFGNDGSYYCPGWAERLQIYMTSGGAKQLRMNNHLNFWGVVAGPSAALTTGTGSGSPQVEIWGAITANTADVNAQWTLHYDDSLSDLDSGEFQVVNWREESVD